MTLRAKDPEKALQRDREWGERSAERYQDRLRERHAAGEEFARLERTGELPKQNRDRIKKLREKQFGTKGKWITSMPCCVTGNSGSETWPIDPAHTGSPDRDVRGQSTRGAGADLTFMVPMWRPVHGHFDNLPEDKWLELYGVSKQMVREHAASLHAKWLEMNPEPVA